MMPRRTSPWEVRPESAAVTVVGRAKAAIGILADELKSEEFKTVVGIKVSEVFKGGSLGQGTQVPGNYDIDLVLYSESLTVKSAVDNRGYKELLDKITEFLKKHGHGKDYEYHSLKIGEDDAIIGIKFIYPFCDNREEISVDLFLSPNFRRNEDLLTQLQEIDIKARIMFSVSASKWQTRFISKQTQWVKEFCRRFKAWRTITWKESTDGQPRSYLLTILVVIAFDKLPDDKKKMKKRRMSRIVPLMTQNLKILVSEIKSADDLDLFVPGSKSELRKRYKNLLPACPRIIDPVNPGNNLYFTGIKRSKEKNKWTPFARNIAQLNLNPDLMEKKYEDLTGCVSTTRMPQTRS